MSKPTSRQALQQDRVCILVMGMHRSGTSALTRVLNLLGCRLPSDLLGSNHSNPEGHWESVKAIEINDSLLAALGRRWDDVRELPVDWYQRPETDIARQQIRAFVDKELSAHPLSVLKEPRLCHLGPLWIDVLQEAGIEPKIIIPVRHPAEVAYSLARRDGIALGRAHLMWMQHLLDSEAATRKQRRVLTHFHELLQDWRTQVETIASTLGVAWKVPVNVAAQEIDEFLRPNLRHANARSSQDIGSKMPLPGMVDGLYRSLCTSVGDEPWKAIESVALKVAEAAPLYSPSIAEIAQRLERSEHEAAAANKMLSTSIADRERRQNAADRVVIGVEESVPLLQQLIRQVEQQRSEFRPAMDQQLQHAVQWRTETQMLLERPDQLPPLLHGLSRQVAEQHAEIIPALDAQGSSIVSLVERFESQRGEVISAFGRQGETLVNLVGRFDQHRAEVVPALRQQSEIVAAVARQQAEHRAEMAPALAAHGELLAELAERLNGHQDELRTALEHNRDAVAQLATQLAARDAQVAGLQRVAMKAERQLHEQTEVSAAQRERAEALLVERKQVSTALAQREFQLEAALREQATLASQLDAAARNAMAAVELEAEIARQDSQLSSLLETLELQQRETLDVERAAAAREALLRSDIADRDRQIAELSEASTNLRLRSDSLYDQLTHAQQLLATRDTRISALSHDLFKRDQALADVFASHSWRVTRPLRKVTSFLRGKELHDSPTPGFDAAWYLRQYPDIASSGLDPYEHFVTAGRDEGRQPLPPAPPRPPSAPSTGMLAWFGRRTGNSVAESGTGEQAGGAAHALGDESFDREFYLLQYPDIAQAGMDPYQHYVKHGKAEGRQGARPRLVLEAGGAQFDADRETVLVVSHEASRTGAPVLSLNISEMFQARYNVITLLLGGGPLVGAFREASALLAGPMELRGSPLRTSLIIEQLLALHKVKFAVVNSIESRDVLEPLARRGVAAVSLVHEFAAYTRPRHAFRDAVYWAGDTIFSTSITHENAVHAFPELASHQFNIVPQGRCTLLAESVDERTTQREKTRLLRALRPLGELDKSVVILGAGFVQQRKGVDLFIKCAARVLKSEIGANCRFVWIGSGYDPDNDMGYSVYLADQLRRSGLDRRVLIINETSSIETAYAAADILLVSSRLDPLPNVAIDAMAHGLPVLCFDKTTGIADVLHQAGLSDILVSPYLDTTDMARKIQQLAVSPDLRREVGQRVREVVEDRFNMRVYIDQVEQIATQAADQLRQQPGQAREIAASGLLQADYCLPPNSADDDLETLIEHRYLRAWSHGIGRRKPFPGFHPGIYKDANSVAPDVDPFVEYLRAGSPEGPWLQEMIDDSQSPAPVPAGMRVALHLHVFYPDMLEDILLRLNANKVRPDLLVSVPDTATEERVVQLLASYDGMVASVQVVPNRGRDIGPLLTAFAPALLRDYDLVGHLHTKKSLDLNDAAFAARWSRFLLENLLGGKAPMADIVLGRMAADPGIGMVFPDDPHVVGWGENLEFARELGPKLGVAEFPEHPVFPIGTMFWARVDALRPLLELGLGWDDYPVEPLPYDGSILHALERLFPLVAATGGKRCLLTYVSGVSR